MRTFPSLLLGAVLFAGLISAPEEPQRLRSTPELVIRPRDKVEVYFQITAIPFLPVLFPAGLAIDFQTSGIPPLGATSHHLTTQWVSTADNPRQHTSATGG